MRARRIIAAAAILVLIATPFLIRRIYLSYTQLPQWITIATGPINGEWHVLSHNLLRSIESKTGVDVRASPRATEGALHHLELLQKKKVDFALYLRGSRRLQQPGAQDQGPPPMFVGNLYSDLTLFLVRRDLYEGGELRTPADLSKRRDEGSGYSVAVGHPQTGEHSIAQVILNYYFGDERDSFEELDWDYEQVEEGFTTGKLDAALITAGHQAPVFKRLLQRGAGICALGEMPEVDAIVMKNVGLKKVEVPQGLFRSRRHNIPRETLDTVASQTMLLTHEDVSSQMVEEVTKILLSEDFIRENQLFELSHQGRAFASGNPEFTIHPGALAVYEPGLKPLVDPDFMDSTESFRSFAVSLLVAGFLAYRWYRSYAERRKDHRLDEFFAELLRIDRTADYTIGNQDEAAKMQQTLEHVLALRNDALGEFSAKDFDEDSAADSFLNLCEAVASGIRVQLLRWQLRQSIAELTQAIQSTKRF